jgi:CheY-like chemotaxis protein
MANDPSNSGQEVGSKMERRPYVLLVEDSVLTRKVYRSAFMTAGYDVGEATGVKAALEEVGRHKPDVMIIDLILEEGEGTELAQAIKERGGHDQIILVSVTSAQDEKRLAAVRAAPFDSRQKKPVKIDDLVSEVGRLIEQKGIVFEPLPVRNSA